MDGQYKTLFFSIILHIFLLFTFLSILYWFVIRNVEERSLYQEIDKSIENQLSKISISSDIFTEDDYDYLKTLHEGKNIAKEKNNALLLTLNITIIVALLIFLILSIFIRYKICGQTINFKEIIIENILILIIVGTIEYLFFKNIASKYVPVMPSEIPKKVEETIKKKLE